jgi:O-antigen/teichoic acid export membrane protein
VLKRFAKDVVIYGGVDFLFRLAQFAALPVYAHLLSVADFGLLALLTVTATLMGMLLNLGINNAVQRFYFDPEIEEADRPAVVSTGLAQLVLSGLLVTAVGGLVLLALHEEIRAAWGIGWLLLLIVLLTALPEQLAQFMLDAVRLQFAPWKFCAIALIKNLSGVLLGLWLMIYWDLGLAGLLLGTLLAAVAAVPIGVLMIRRDLTLRIRRKLAGEIFRYGYPFVFAGAAYWVFGSMDRWMLMALTGPDQVGLFSIGFKLGSIVTFLIFAFSQAWSPYAFKAYGESPNYRSIYARILSVWFFFLAFVGLGISLFGREVLMLLTPPEYWPAAPIIGICAAGLALYGTTFISNIGVSIERKTILLTYAAWLAAIANVLLNLALIPYLGAMGAAASTFLSYGVLAGSLLFWSQRLHPLPLEKAKLAFSCMIVCLSFAAAVISQYFEVSLVAGAAKAAVLVAVLGSAFLVRIVDLDLYRAMRAGRKAGLTATQ